MVKKWYYWLCIQLFQSKRNVYLCIVYHLRTIYLDENHSKGQYFLIGQIQSFVSNIFSSWFFSCESKCKSSKSRDPTSAFENIPKSMIPTPLSPKKINNESCKCNKNSKRWCADSIFLEAHLCDSIISDIFCWIIQSSNFINFLHSWRRYKQKNCQNNIDCVVVYSKNLQIKPYITLLIISYGNQVPNYHSSKKLYNFVE